jgi:hypothetical protein
MGRDKMRWDDLGGIGRSGGRENNPVNWMGPKRKVWKEEKIRYTVGVPLPPLIDIDININIVFLGRKELDRVSETGRYAIP